MFFLILKYSYNLDYIVVWISYSVRQVSINLALKVTLLVLGVLSLQQSGCKCCINMQVSHASALVSSLELELQFHQQNYQFNDLLASNICFSCYLCHKSCTSLGVILPGKNIDLTFSHLLPLCLEGFHVFLREDGSLSP